MNPFSLEGKNILITGGSSGIGRQCAITCSKMGARLILIGRREEKLAESARLLDKSNALLYPFDIDNFNEIEPVISDAVGKIGPINGFIHSAGLELVMPLSVTKPEHYQKLFATNVIAGFEFARILSRRKYCAGEGASFVFIASVRGFLGEIAQAAYCSSKGAVIAGTKAMALELAEKKIRVNCISPAIVKETEMTSDITENPDDESRKEIFKMHPLGYGTTSDIAYGCIYLLSEASRWVTGTNLIIDGGYSAK